MNSSNISFNIHAQYQVSKFQEGPNFLSKNKKMKKTILASINSQDFSSSDMNTGLNVSKDFIFFLTILKIILDIETEATEQGDNEQDATFRLEEIDRVSELFSRNSLPQQGT